MKRHHFLVLLVGAICLFACDFSSPSNDGGSKPSPLRGTTEHWYHPPDNQPGPENPSTRPPGLPEIPECGKEYPLTIVYTRPANCDGPYVTASNLQDAGDQFQYAVRAATCTSAECPVADYKYTATYTECKLGVSKAIVTGVVFCVAKAEPHAPPTAALVPLRKVEVTDPSKIDLNTGYRATVAYVNYTSSTTSFELLPCGTTAYYEYVYREKSVTGCDFIGTYEPYVLKAELASQKAGADSITCMYPCTRRSNIVRREWRCDVIPNKNSGEKDGWVTVTIDYAVECKGKP